MVERIPPAAAAAAAALAAALAAGGRSGAAALAFAAGALLCAASLAPAAARGRLRTAGRLAASVGFGVAAGGLAAMAVAAGAMRTYVGFAPDAVAAIEAAAVEDSRPSRSGGSIVLVRLQRVSGRDGAAAPAAGECLLLLARGERVSSGERLRAKGSLSREADPQVPFFFEASAIERRGYAGPGARLRARARSAVERRADSLGYPASALLLALFLGDRYGIPAEMEEAFASTGTLHLLALSGVHVGAIYLLAGTLLKPLLPPRTRWGVVAVLALAYLWLAGPAPSLLRATLGFAAAGASRLTDRDYRPFNLLGLVLLLHIAIDPRDAATLAFQLSYLAVAGLAAGHALLARPLQRWLPPAVALPVAATAGAQAATLPLVLSAFGAWYPVGFVASLLGAPLVMLFLCVGLAALPLARLPGVEAAAPRLLGLMYDVMLQGGRLLARVPPLTIAAGAAGAAGAAAAGLAPLLGRRRP
jgi:ComEC/Rec2-related protein